jgi:ribosomal protein S27E
MTTQLRKIPLERFLQLDDDMAGLCSDCGHEQPCCEPDAERYRCEACGEREVYGPHWYLMTGKVT